MTGEIHFVDSGYNIVSMPRPKELKAEEAREVAEIETPAPMRSDAPPQMRRLSLIPGSLAADRFLPPIRRSFMAAWQQAVM